MAYRRDISGLVQFLWLHDTLDPPPAYWLENDDGGMEYGPEWASGGDWCLEHAEDIAMRMNLYTPGGRTYALRCSDPCGESDVIPYCSTCGITLAGWPTNYCLSEERAFFESDPTFALSPENLHVIGMALWNLQWAEDTEDLFAWRAIGQNVADRITFLPGYPRMTVEK